MKEIITTTLSDESFDLGKRLGSTAQPGDVYALSGELGCGKTVVAKGIAEGMGITEDITSPTFTLLEIYEHTLPLYHFDLYRIENEAELDQLSFEDYWEGRGVSVIEWAERAGDRLPDNTLRIHIEYINSTTRRIEIEHPDN
jgi:tRNA threonylcarbamoyladenosine biosynthesis protein TsaE